MTPAQFTIPRLRRTPGALLGALLGAAALAPLARAGAQGSLGMQGFGYPTGELSTRALGTGGAMSEFDPASAINPAALASWGRAAITLQYDPEFRRVTSASGSQSATLTRFPLFAIALPVRQRFRLGVSASTLLDRTFSTEVPATGTIGGTVVNGTQRVESRGSISDLRIGGGWIVSPHFAFGVAGHLLSGANHVVSGRVFNDTTQFANVSDSTVVDFTGTAVSAGAEWRVVRGLAFAGSYRLGGTMRASRNDTTLRTANAADRWGIGVRFDRLTGASFLASYASTKWTNMRGLGSSEFSVNDAPELSVGVEAAGPRVGNNVSSLRLGGRRRTLPFGINGAEIRETAFSGGLGTPFSGGRATLDLGVQHASRTPHGGTLTGADEKAWTLSVGLTVRP